MIRPRIEEVLRIEGGRVLATLIRLTGSFDLAEEAVQDAVIRALESWSEESPPANPGAWLTRAAWNKALDRIRRENLRPSKEAEALELWRSRQGTPEDELRLLFTCCHPALSLDAQVALCLRTLCRLTTREISRAFLVPEPTVSQRITRAKKKIAQAHIPYRIPSDEELPDRLEAVLAVIYLVFTTGHHPPAGEIDARTDLATEAIRLARRLVELMPRESEAVGLLALLLATQARSAARLDGDREVVTLDRQDRTLWDHGAVAAAAALLQRASRSGERGVYRIQAEIAVLHGEASTFAATDWRRIVARYRLLERLRPTSVVRLNRAVAEAELHGPQRGLDLLDDLGLEDWYLYWAARADFLRRLGRDSEAAEAYRETLRRCLNDSDRRLFEGRQAELAARSQEQPIP